MNKNEELQYATFLFIATLLFLYSLVNSNSVIILSAFLFSILAFRLYRKQHPRINRNYQDIVKGKGLNEKVN